MKKKPKILVTNDDGIDAPGIRHLWNAVKGIGEIAIVAPTSEKSGSGVGLTLKQPLTIQPVKWDGETSAWKINGTPADCVRFALSVLFKEKPDLIISGINRGSNSGRNVLYSGTVGGVIEGALKGIFGIAFSCESFDQPNYAHVESYILPIVQHFLLNPQEAGTVLNVNFPEIEGPFKGLKLARQGRGFWAENPERRVHPDGDDYYWHGGKWVHHDEPEESDVALLKQGYITAVPIHVNELTDHQFLQKHKEHFEKLFLR